MSLDDDTTFLASGVVAARRRSRGRGPAGDRDPPRTRGPGRTGARSCCAVADAPAADHSPTVPLERVAARSRIAVAVDRVVMAVVVVTSVAVIGALVLVLLGFRPLVVRSGSMVPTYEVGDVVLVEQTGPTSCARARSSAWPTTRSSARASRTGCARCTTSTVACRSRHGATRTTPARCGRWRPTLPSVGSSRASPPSGRRRRWCAPPRCPWRSASACWRSSSPR